MERTRWDSEQTTTRNGRRFNLHLLTSCAGSRRAALLPRSARRIAEELFQSFPPLPEMLRFDQEFSLGIAQEDGSKRPRRGVSRLALFTPVLTRQNSWPRVWICQRNRRSRVCPTRQVVFKVDWVTDATCEVTAGTWIDSNRLFFSWGWLN